MTDPDFSYRDGDKIIYGKKYDDIKAANGFTSVALDLHDNTLSPIHSGFDVFTEKKLDNHDIKWYTEVDVDTPLDSVLTTESIASRGQLSDRFDDKIHSGDHKVNPDSAKTSKNSDIKLSARGDRVIAMVKLYMWKK